MLDQLSDVDLERPSKPAAQSAKVEESIRHLAQTELEAYANGQLAGARLDFCRTHLDSCEACRAELEDLRLFKSEMAGFERAASSGRAQQQRKRRGGSGLLVAGSAAVVLALGVGGAVFWWGHRSPRANKAPAVASVAKSAPASGRAALPVTAPHVAATPAAARVAKADPAPAPAPAPLPLAASHVAAPHVAATPVSVTPVGATPTAPEANREFVLLGPLGGPVTDTRPEFSWQPLPGAVKYSVVIVDSGLHRVKRSPALRKTVWRPRGHLRRGRTYLWQVTATLRGGHKVVASAPGTLIVGAADSQHESR